MGILWAHTYEPREYPYSSAKESLAAKWKGKIGSKERLPYMSVITSKLRQESNLDLGMVAT